MNSKIIRRIKRQKRIVAKIKKSEYPRLSIFRSNTGLYAAIRDKEASKTLIAVSVKGKNQQKASELGKKIAELAVEKGITSIVFDRSGYRFTGKIKALADAAKEGGLKF